MLQRQRCWRRCLRASGAPCSCRSASVSLGTCAALPYSTSRCVTGPACHDTIDEQIAKNLLVRTILLVCTICIPVAS